MANNRESKETIDDVDSTLVGVPYSCMVRTKGVQRTVKPGHFPFSRFSDYTLVLATVDSHALVMGTYSCLGIESEERTAN